jgi:hypothetical protein
MGNKLNKKNILDNKNSLNDKCPICLLDFNNEKIILNCSHKIHVNCGLMLCKKIINTYEIISCPYCRKELNNNEINLFLKNKIHNIEIEDPEEWNRKDILDIKRNKISSIGLTNYSKLKSIEYLYLIPYIKNKNLKLDLPFYYKITTLKNINVIDHEINNLNLGFEMYLSASTIYYYQYNLYLEKLIVLIKEKFSNYNLDSINIDYKNLKKKLPKIRLVVEDTNEINIFDNYNGNIKKGLILENLNFDIIIKPIIIIDNKNIYYMNKLISILYY